jgi:hypothetical protein
VLLLYRIKRALVIRANGGKAEHADALAVVVFPSEVELPVGFGLHAGSAPLSLIIVVSFVIS